MARPRLVQAFADSACFTLDEAVAELRHDRAAVRKEIEYLRRTGYVTLVRRGLYAMEPAKAGTAPVDRFVLASKLTEPHLLGYHSALELHGVAESASYNEVYVCAEGWFEPVEYRQTLFRSVGTDRRLIDQGATTVKRSGLTLPVACRELALLQCAGRLEYAGGLSELLNSVAGFPYLKWERLLELLDLIDKTVLYRKTGFLVDHHADRWRPPSDLLDRIKSKTGRGATYFGIRPNEGGVHVAGWNVIVPAEFAQRDRLE